MTKLTTEITIEKLQYRINAHENDITQMWTADYFLSVQKELLALKQAAKNPVAWVATDSEGFPEYSGHNEFSSSCGAGTPLYAAPVLPELVESLKKVMNSWLAMEPKLAYHPEFTDVMMLLDAEAAPAQPELPQGFTYESGILTANFGNGDILISDTHWHETGHAGISFAPVPQPKRPNLSDYKDLMGGSKTEDIGTLFIVKSNSAESLIVIRDKLDIAINALSPANAQPVIPERRQRISDDDFVSVPRSVLACAGYAYRKAGLKDRKAYAELKKYQFAPAITAQPVSEPKRVGYFSYGTEHGFNWHQTAKQATDDAEAMIDDYRGDACDGWSEETDNVCWGVILQQATKVDERPRTDDDYGDPVVTTVCDYALLPAQESE